MKKIFACICVLVVLCCTLLSSCDNAVYSELYCNLTDCCNGFSPITEFRNIRGEISSEESIRLESVTDKNGNTIEHYHLFVQWEED